MGEIASTYQAMPQTSKASELFNSFSGLIGAMGRIVEEQEKKYDQTIYGLQANQQVAGDNIVANGKRKEVIAILNTMYEAGLFDHKITKAELFERASVAFGDAGLKDYATPLSQIMQTYKYDGIFDKLAEVAKQQQEISDKK